MLRRATAYPDGLHDGADDDALDLVLVAALELAPRDDEVRTLVAGVCAALDRRPGHGAGVLGARLMRRAGLTPHDSPLGKEPLMARVQIDDTTMTVHVQGLHQLLGFRRRISAPLAHVRGATADPGVMGETKGTRAPGLGLGRVATIGTFHRDGRRHFWDVTAKGTPIVIELEDEPYERLIVEVDDPRTTVDKINAAASPRRES